VTAPILDFLPGDWVLCQWRGGHFWFPGIVHSINGNSIAIQYDDGSSEIRPANQVRHYDWRIGTRIHAFWEADQRWYDATVTEMEPNGADLTVRYDDGTIEKTRTSRCRSL